MEAISVIAGLLLVVVWIGVIVGLINPKWLQGKKENSKLMTRKEIAWGGLGAGNFKNLLIYTPNGKEKGLNVIPLAEVAAKDEFYNIKIASRDDQLAGHRIPPQLMGVVPQNSGGFGDIEKAARVFYYNEIVYYQNLLKQINDRLGIEVIKFKEYDLISSITKP